jgi:hypothetical protein
MGTPVATLPAGLTVLAEARWSEPDDTPPPVAGFIISSFSPLVADVARRCLGARPSPPPTGGARCAIVLATSCGDVTSAVTVAVAVDTGERVGPLLFFQSVPNAVAGYVAARAGLTGPVVCVSAPDNSLVEGLAEAELLLADGDADEALVIAVDQDPDRAVALLVTVEEPEVRGGEE